MIGTIMILLGMVMMVWPCRHQAAPAENFVGHPLREAFGQPTHEPLPDDMARASRRVAGALRIVRTK